MMGDVGVDDLKLHSREQFQVWLAREVEVRDELEQLLGEPLGLEPSSLDVVERFLLQRYRTPDDALALSERAVIDAASRHIGLVMLLNVDGAKWAIDLDNPDNAYYRLPIIQLADEAEECPLFMATAAIDRRTGEYLRSMVEGYQEIHNSPDAG